MNDTIILDKSVIQAWVYLLANQTYDKQLTWESSKSFNTDIPSPYHQLNEWYRCLIHQNCYAYLVCFPNRDQYEISITHNNQEPKIIASASQEHFKDALLKLYKAITVTCTGVSVDQDTCFAIRMYLERYGIHLQSIHDIPEEDEEEEQ